MPYRAPIKARDPRGGTWVWTWYITTQPKLINTPLTRSTTATRSVYLPRRAGGLLPERWWWWWWWWWCGWGGCTRDAHIQLWAVSFPRGSSLRRMRSLSSTLDLQTRGLDLYRITALFSKARVCLGLSCVRYLVLSRWHFKKRSWKLVWGAHKLFTWR